MIAIESITNVAVGMLINVTLCQWVIFPWLGIPVTIDQNVVITVVLTVTAFMRNYGVRWGFRRWT
jgi:hypothetical protein